METSILNSGSEVLNNLLSGGYESGVVNTIYGPAGSGKTTMCLLAAISCIKNNKKVIFIDTEGGFSIIRLNQLTNNNKEILEKIFILNPTTFEEQVNTLKRLKELINDKIGLIVIDTISMLYRIEFGKQNKDIKAINAELGLQVSYLTEIARKNNIPVLLTNQVYSDFEEKDAVKMVGGDILKYGSKCLIELKKFRNARKAVIKKHRFIPENKEAIFSIKEEGFEEINSPQ